MWLYAGALLAVAFQDSSQQLRPTFLPRSTTLEHLPYYPDRSLGLWDFLFLLSVVRFISEEKVES